MKSKASRNRVRKYLVVLSSLFVILIGTIIGGKIYYNSQINGYPDTTHFARRMAKLKFENSHHKTILVFHKPGCSDCLVARAVIKSELQNAANQAHSVVINTNDPAAKQYIAEYGVTKVPTIIYLKGNQVIDSTSSTNADEIKRVMRGGAK